MKRWKQCIWVLVVTISMVMMPVAANAYTLLQCDNNGKAVQDTSLFDTDPNDSTGECQYSNLPPIQHIFSYVVCDFVGVLNQIMDNMYCGINYYLVNVVAALVTLYLTIYGAQILMGTAQLSTRDAIIRMLKISFIYVFATQSAYGISFIFQFFISVISTTSTAVLNVLNTQAGNIMAAKNDGVCNFDGLDSSNLMSMYSFLDYMVCHALIGPASQGSTRVQGLMLAMIGSLFPMTALFQWWLATTIKTLVVTVVTFLKCLAAIAFLVTLSPFFLGFFLFQSTAYVFENWLRYLISYSVQICLVLSIIVLWILSINQFIAFFNQLSGMIYPYKPVLVAGDVYQPSNGWAICQGEFSTDTSGGPTNGEPTASCSMATTDANPPDLDGATPVVSCDASEARAFDANPPVCKGTAPNITCDPPANPSWQCDNLNLKPPSDIINQKDFLYFVFFHFFALLLICYCFSMLLQQADKIARSLAGPQSVPSLTPGWGGNLGNVNSFKAPPAAGAAPAGGQAQNLAQDFHKLVGNRP